MIIKKGYTLIEVITVLCIMSILCALFSNYWRAYNKYSNDVQITYCSSSIMTFINMCKQYCYYERKSGYIKFDLVNEELDFYEGTKRKRSWRLPKGFDLYGTTAGSRNNQLNFDMDGFTPNACTITYKDRYNSIHNITICVGTAYVQIQE